MLTSVSGHSINSETLHSWKGRDASIGLKRSQFIARTNRRLLGRFSDRSHECAGAFSRHRCIAT